MATQVIEFANLIDDICKQLHRKNQGIPINEEDKMGCLLRMDDVALISSGRETLQQMMECTNYISRRYCIELGAAKMQK